MRGEERKKNPEAIKEGRCVDNPHGIIIISPLGTSLSCSFKHILQANLYTHFIIHHNSGRHSIVSTS